MKRHLLLAWILLVSFPRMLFAFDGARAKAIIDTIASDAYEGRKSGLAGARRAEEFAAARLRAWGLEPGGPDGSFFHEFPMLVTEERGARLELLGGPYGSIRFLQSDDFNVVINSGSADLEAEVVAVGYGLSDGARGRDDYAGADVRGKIVLIIRETPDDGRDWELAGSRDSTLQEAMARGAVGVLWNRGEKSGAGETVHEGSYFPGAPLFSVSLRVVGHLLEGTGYDIKRYKDELKKGPLPLATGKRVRVHTDVRLVPDGRARNVVGIVPGADPLLAREIVVVGGHLDGVGTGADRIVHNAANDNASGASVVLELARSFAAGKTKPARTLVFALFAAEEQGLGGSRAFVDDPPIDLGAVVTMLNYDMEGHGSGKVGIGGGEYFPEMWDAFTASLDSAVAESLVVARPWGGESSDHSPFRNAGIPAFSVWGDGDHRFYHEIGDDPEWIDEGVLGIVGRLSERWIRALADHPEPLLAPHRAGRTLLAASDQVDWDGVLGENAPPFVRGRVRWLDGAEAASGTALVSAIASERARIAESESLVRVSGAGEIRGATREGKGAVLLGLRGSAARALASEEVGLLGDLGVRVVSYEGTPVTEDSKTIQQMIHQGIALLIPSDDAWKEPLSKSGKAYLRFYPGRGEGIEDPGSFPSKKFLFIASLERGMDPSALAETIRAIGWDRFHLDLVPWVAAGGGSEIPAFLEEIQEAGGFEPREMRGVLGGNLGRV